MNPTPHESQDKHDAPLFASTEFGVDPSTDTAWMATEETWMEGAPGETGYSVTDIDESSLQRIVGQAISLEDGILGLKGKLTDVFKQDDDLTRGVSVHLKNDGKVAVKARLIAESGYDPASLINRVTQDITDAMESTAGLRPEKVEVDIAETLTRSEFLEKYSTGRELH